MGSSGLGRCYIVLSVKVGVHNQKRVEPVEPVECDDEYQLVQETQRLNLTTTP